MSNRAADVGQQAASDIIEAQRACADAIGYIEQAVVGDVNRAVLGLEVDDDHPMPEVHRVLQQYFYQMETAVVVNRPRHYSGDAYDGPLAEVGVPYPQSVMTDGFSQTDIVPIEGIGDIEEWSLRQMDIPAEGATRVFLSPRAVKNLYRELLRLQVDLGLHAQTRPKSGGGMDGDLNRSR